MKRALYLFLGFFALSACTGGSSGSTADTSDFISAPPAGQGGGGGGGVSAGADMGLSAAADGGSSSTTSTTANGRVVQETDLYRVDGNTLYYLNSYRGLMVFDITNVDQPRLLGRSAIFGTPIDMIVANGIATVIVSDWYGTDAYGDPFYGSLVRGLDATDPTHIKVLGDAYLQGWVQDSRVVGNVLYTVSEDYGWSYGWNYYENTSQSQIIVASVLFGNGTVTTVAQKTYPGWSGIFNVTPNSILLAHDLSDNAQSPTPLTELRYLDITDPNGAIVERGSIEVPAPPSRTARTTAAGRSTSPTARPRTSSPAPTTTATTPATCSRPPTSRIPTRR